jgi:hypothetical protein
VRQVKVHQPAYRKSRKTFLGGGLEDQRENIGERYEGRRCRIGRLATGVTEGREGVEDAVETSAKCRDLKRTVPDWSKR